MNMLKRAQEAFLVVIASFWLFGHLGKALILLPVTILRQKMPTQRNSAKEDSK